MGKHHNQELPDLEFISGSMDFADLIKDSMDALRTDLNPGDKLSGRVTRVNQAGVFLDFGGKAEGIIPLVELMDEEGLCKVAVGDFQEAYFISDDGGEVLLTVKLSGAAVADILEEALAQKIPVEGKVVAERKGGFEISLSGLKAFCPYSQMDLRPSEAAGHIGQLYSFLVTQIKGRDVVVSRRDLLERESEARREALKESLEIGAEVEGVVRRIERFGVFVDIGGVDGMIPASELSWKRNFDPSQIVHIKQKVHCTVLRLDWDAGKITLSFRRAHQDPLADESLHVGAVLAGKITRVVDFGVFVELTEGVEGLLHNSVLKGISKKDLQEGEEITVEIRSIDLEQRRLELSLPPTGTVADTPATGDDEVTESVFDGTVDEIKPFGLIVSLPDGRRGLMHVSAMNLPPQADKARYLAQHFKTGDKIHVEVQRIEGSKISLVPAGTGADASEASATLKNLHEKSAKAAFGSLSDLFGGIKL